MMKVDKVIVETGRVVEGSVREEGRKAAEASTLGTGYGVTTACLMEVMSRRVEGQFA